MTVEELIIDNNIDGYLLALVDHCEEAIYMQDNIPEELQSMDVRVRTTATNKDGLIRTFDDNYDFIQYNSDSAKEAIKSIYSSYDII